MKTARKLLSVLLALTLVLALGVSASAAGTITVANPPAGVTYDAYKIFEADVSGSDVVYKIQGGSTPSPWLAAVYDGSASKIAGLTITGPDASDKYTVSWGPGFSAADFAAKMRAYATANSITPDKNDVAADGSGIVTITPLDPGYYLVFPNTGAMASLTTVLDTKTVTIQNKNDMPFDKTVDDVKVEGVQVGDTLNYRLTGVVPTVASTDTYYVYLISDKMDAGLAFGGSVTAWIDANGNGTKDAGEEITLTTVVPADAVLTGDQVRYGQNDKTFELSLDMLTRGKNTALQGKHVYIDYTATVTKDAVAVVSENNAVLEYGNDSSSLTVKDSQTKVYDSQIIVDKFENGAPEQKLQDAQFILMKYADSADAPGVDDSSKTPYYYKATKDGSGNVTNVEWVAARASATTETTDTNGAAKFSGLEDGVYFLVETAAPAGYSTITDPIKITVDGSSSITPGMDAGQVAMILTNVANVANTPGTVLPSTGGIGTTIFYLVGSVLILGAVVVLLIRKRGEAEA